MGLGKLQGDRTVENRITAFLAVCAPADYQEGKAQFAVYLVLFPNSLQTSRCESWAKPKTTVRLLSLEGVFNTGLTLGEVKPRGVNASFSFRSFKLVECFLLLSKYKSILLQSQKILQKGMVLLRMKIKHGFKSLPQTDSLFNW